MLMPWSAPAGCGLLLFADSLVVSRVRPRSDLMRQIPDYQHNENKSFFALAVATAVAAHFTHLSNFKPLAEGQVTLTLQVAGETLTWTENTAARERIYKFNVTPAKTGTPMCIITTCQTATTGIIIHGRCWKKNYKVSISQSLTIHCQFPPLRLSSRRNCLQLSCRLSKCKKHQGSSYEDVRTLMEQNP